jgi:single-strand DNA-binding protein
MPEGTQIVIVGNLTGDPETRAVGGANVANFTVVVQDRKFDKDSNEWVDGAASFYRCQAWRDLADHVAASVTKGTRVIVQGRLAQRDYETREGEKRTNWEITVDEIGPSLRFATAAVERRTGNRNQAARREQFAAQGQQPRAAAPQAPQQPAQQAWNAGTAYDDETPF